MNIMAAQPDKKGEVVKWNILKICLGIVITWVLALSTHVVMQDVLHIPYPKFYSKTGAAYFFDYSAKVLAILCLYRLVHDKFSHLSLPVRCLLLFVLIAMLNESLLRLPLMNGIVTSAWVFSLILGLPILIAHLLLACLVVISAPRLPRVWQQILGAFLIGALLHFLLTPVISEHVNMLLAQLPQPRPENIISPPYGLNVLVPAYLSFAEPVVACFILARIVWNKLSLASVKGLSLFVLLIISMRGVLLAPFICIFYANLPPVTAMLSVGQFSLEALVLALMTVLSLRHSSTLVPKLGRRSET
jgi:hypothetical protein